LDTYRLRDLEAKALSDFLDKMLKWDPADRWSAAKLLNHHWLKMIPNYNTHMEREEQHEYKRVNKMECSPSPDDDNLEQLSDGGFSDNVQP
jgi:serine/threonine protein kinase